MYNNYDDLFGCQLQSIYNLETVELQGKESHNQEKVLQSTSVEKTPIKCRTLSIKKITKRQEISFQKNFMKEHAVVFSTCYQNYVEFLRKSKVIIPNQVDPHLPPERKPISLAELLSKDICPLSQIEKKQFQKDLQHQQKLNQFLQFIALKTNQFDSFWLTLAAWKIWILYVPHQRSNYEVNQILELANVISREPLVGYLQQIFDKLNQLQGDCLSEFLDFLQIFCGTVLLVVNEYFQNPYFVEQNELEGPKRACNYSLLSDNSQVDQEVQQALIHADSRKKRKTSF